MKKTSISNSTLNETHQTYNLNRLDLMAMASRTHVDRFVDSYYSYDIRFGENTKAQENIRKAFRNFMRV